MVTIAESWDHEVDILVAGSGAGGLVGAIAAHDLGLSALVVEKADRRSSSLILPVLLPVCSQ